MAMYENLIRECESDLRAGRTQSVAKRLSKLNTVKVPREYRLALANLCRRSGLVSTGLKLLSRIIHPLRSAQIDPPKAEELAEYGVLLHRNGATNEALQTLERVDSARVPESLLYRAFCHFNHWDPDLAIPCLRDYLKSPLEPYARFIGEVNLAAAFVSAGRWQEALDLLERNIATARTNSYVRLQANCHELRGQVFLNLHDLARAKTELEAASGLLSSNTSMDLLFVKKWLAHIQALESRSLTPLLEFKKEALARQDWESLREADRFGLKVEFSEPRFEHLIFGSPFARYRETVFQELDRRLESDFYVLGEPSGPCLDLNSCRLVGSGAEILNPGKKTHQLLEALLRDFYRPMRVGGLFAELFPGEHFDIFSSPDRIHQILRRSRILLKEKGIPVKIVENGTNYSLRVESGFSFLVPLQRMPVDGHHVHLAKLAEFYQPDREFSAKEAREKLKMPKSSFQVLSAWAVANGKLEMRGPKNMVRYRIPRTITKQTSKPPQAA
jgi:tetratricopeptide (TPR) repeat protein